MPSCATSYLLAYSSILERKAGTAQGFPAALLPGRILSEGAAPGPAGVTSFESWLSCVLGSQAAAGPALPGAQLKYRLVQPGNAT